MMKSEGYLPQTPAETPLWLIAVRAAESKKGADIRVLDLRDVTSFTDYFVLCTGSNQRQIQAISDAVADELREQGEGSISLEGYQNAEWVLIDYGSFIVHILTPTARDYYDLERLWRHARNVEIPTPETPAA
jgi:ribosome-associated protein